MSGSSTRRDFLRRATSGALALGTGATPLLADASSHAMNAGPRGFPLEFAWGVASAAYLIEGSYATDGKGQSIWDVYAHTSGKMKNGDNGDLAIDHYRRYRQDVALFKGLGINAYRFSISWPRIIPDGRGALNKKGIGFYDRLVDELLAARIEPYATLYHWDLPQALQDRWGGWLSREVALAFAEYAGVVAHYLSDRVHHFITTNDLQLFVEMGYAGVQTNVGGVVVDLELAPGLKLEPAGLNQVRFNAVLAHGLAVQAIRASARPGTKVGPAEALAVAVPAIDSPPHVKAAELATRALNAPYLGVILEGEYSDAWLASQGKDAPKFNHGDLRAIAAPIDFVGINVYRPRMYVLASNRAPGFIDVPINESHPRMFSAWHLVAPEVMYWAPRLLRSIWKVPAIYITENGCAASDVEALDGRVYDSDRVMYLRATLTYLQRAIGEGIPVKGNFVWSAMDSLGWNDGYGTRFGLVYVEFATQRRIPKLSASWYREVVRRGVVV